MAHVESTNKVHRGRLWSNIRLSVYHGQALNIRIHAYYDFEMVGHARDRSLEFGLDSLLQ